LVEVRSPQKKGGVTPASIKGISSPEGEKEKKKNTRKKTMEEQKSTLKQNGTSRQFMIKGENQARGTARVGGSGNYQESRKGGKHGKERLNNKRKEGGAGP